MLIVEIKITTLKEGWLLGKPMTSKRITYLPVLVATITVVGLIKPHGIMLAVHSLPCPRMETMK